MVAVIRAAVIALLFLALVAFVVWMVTRGAADIQSVVDRVNGAGRL